MLRKIKSQEEIAQKRKRNQIIIGGALILLMVLSTVGYGFFNRETSNNGIQTAEYNGFTFVKNGDSWVLTVEDQNFYFRYLPGETDNVSVSLNLTMNDYSNKPIYFVNDSGFSQYILTDIQRYVLRAQGACIDNCTNLPRKTCADNLIIFSGENRTSVSQNQNCVYLSGDAILASDAFLFKILGIK